MGVRISFPDRSAVLPGAADLQLVPPAVDLPSADASSPSLTGLSVPHSGPSSSASAAAHDTTLLTRLRELEAVVDTQPPHPGAADALRQMAGIHLTMLATGSVPGSAGGFNAHFAAATACVRRLQAEFGGSPEALSAVAELHSHAASMATTSTEKQSLWQTALQALEALRRRHPDSLLVAGTLVHLAAQAYDQASSAARQSPGTTLMSTVDGGHGIRT